jgi:hypothetical protein
MSNKPVEVYADIPTQLHGADAGGRTCHLHYDRDKPYGDAFEVYRWWEHEVGIRLVLSGPDYGELFAYCRVCSAQTLLHIGPLSPTDTYPIFLEARRAATDDGWNFVNSTCPIHSEAPSDSRQRPEGRLSDYGRGLFNRPDQLGELEVHGNTIHGFAAE